MNASVTQLGTEKDPAVRLRQLWGRNITRLRDLRGMTRAELAALCEVTEAAVGQWERGETAPRPHKQIAAAKALDAEHGVVFPMVAA